MQKRRGKNQRRRDFLRLIEVLVIQTFLGGRAALKAETISKGAARNPAFLDK